MPKNTSVMPGFKIIAVMITFVALIYICALHVLK